MLRFMLESGLIWALLGIAFLVAYVYGVSVGERKGYDEGYRDAKQDLVDDAEAQIDAEYKDIREVYE